MNKLFKNIIVFMGTIFTIFMGVFGLTGVYTSAIGTNDYGADSTYFLTFGLICLAIASIAGFLSVKLHYLR
jgi:hypothetical protein